MTRRCAVVAALIALALMTVSGCSSAPSATNSTAPGAAVPSSGDTGSGAGGATAASAPPSPVPSTTVVDGLGLAILQNRPDYGARRLQLSITNGSTAPVTVTAARFSSPAFVAPVDAAKGTAVPAGLTRFLPVALPESVCPAPSADPELTVTVLDPDGTSREVTGKPADPFGVLQRIAAEDCLDDAVAAVAVLRLSDELDVSGEGTDAVAHLQLVIEPTAAGTGTSGTSGLGDADGTRPTSSLHLDHAAPTILLEPADGAEWPLDVTVSPGDARVVLTLDAVPARCDPHAVAEDKRGTFLPVTVELAGFPAGTVTIGSTDPLRRALYRYLATACGFTLPVG